MAPSSLRIPPPPPSLGPRRHRSRPKHQRDTSVMLSPLTSPLTESSSTSGQADGSKSVRQATHDPDVCPLGNTDGVGSFTQLNSYQSEAVEVQEDIYPLRKGLLAKPEPPLPTSEDKVDTGEFPDSSRPAIVASIQAKYLSKAVTPSNSIQRIHVYAGHRFTNSKMKILKTDIEQEVPATPVLEQIFEDGLDKRMKASISGAPGTQALDGPTGIPIFDEATLKEIEKEIAAATQTSILLPPDSVPTDVIFRHTNPRNPGKCSTATSEAKKKPIGANERPAKRVGCGGEELPLFNSGIPLPVLPWPAPLEHPSADLGALTPSSIEFSSPERVLEYDSSSRMRDMEEFPEIGTEHSGTSTPRATGSHTIDILFAASSPRSLETSSNSAPQPLITEVQSIPAVEIDKWSNIGAKTYLKNDEVGCAFDVPMAESDKCPRPEEVMKHLVTDTNLKIPDFVAAPPKLIKSAYGNIDTRKESLNTIIVNPDSSSENIHPNTHPLSMNSKARDHRKGEYADCLVCDHETTNVRLNPLTFGKRRIRDIGYHTLSIPVPSLDSKSGNDPDTPRSRRSSLRRFSGLQRQVTYVDGPAEAKDKTFDHLPTNFCYPEAFAEMMSGFPPGTFTSTAITVDSTSAASTVSMLPVPHPEYGSARRNMSLSGTGARMRHRSIEDPDHFSNRTLCSVSMGSNNPHEFEDSPDGKADPLAIVSSGDGRAARLGSGALDAPGTDGAHDPIIKERLKRGEKSENPKKPHKPQIDWNKLLEAEGPQTVHKPPIKDSRGNIIWDMSPTDPKKPRISCYKLRQHVEEEGPQTVHTLPVKDSQGNIIRDVPSTGSKKPQIDWSKLCDDVEAEGQGNVHTLPIQDRKGNIIRDVPQNGPKKLRKKRSSVSVPSSYHNTIQPRYLDGPGTASTTTLSLSLPTTTTAPDQPPTPIASLLFVLSTHLITPIATPAINFTIITRFLTTACFDFLAYRDPPSHTHHASLPPRELYQVETRDSVQSWLDNQQRQGVYTHGDTLRERAREFALEGQYRPGRTSGGLDGIDERTEEDDECAVEEDDDGEDEQRKRWRELERLRRQLGRAGVGVRPTMGIGMSPAMSFVA
ncbi:hypothetical protein EX30DRAFT_374578 [Ascodesmis nigricans]|uniref:Uncharacterized protein n=1 Tax=Ascodesmis nigricans TaxID=341454 RepID=A0A4S2MKH5_9PEZI|nr:hypothetical protein EX30DRAFT_374578 [Ascodesmis nigricans]